MIVKRCLAAWLLMLALVPALVHAEATATLNRNSVQLGETVTLNVRVDGNAGSVGTLDLRALEQDFDVLGTSQNNSYSIINGSASSQKTFGVVLRPKHAGTLQIPALNVAGSATAPLQLVVAEPDASAAAAGQRDIFMEAAVEPKQAYVGQQLSYVLRLYYATSISNGAVGAPQADGVEVSRIGDDLGYDAERGGRSYHVLERRYALMPQRAGSVTIPAVDFQGEAIDPSDPNSFFGSTTAVSARSPTLTLDIQVAPADWGSSAWLPARQLNLSLDGWPGAQDQVRVGQPLNLTMNLLATGLPFEVLPALSLPPLDGAKAYPDKPVTSTGNDGTWLIGRRQQTFAIVPERAGTLTIPATTVKWWNVVAGRAEVAEIPAHSVTVLPALAVATTPAAAPVHDEVTIAVATPWRWIALGSLGLWLASVLAWWVWRRRHSTSAVAALRAEPVSARRSQLLFLAAARGQDGAAQARSLLAWARAERPSIQHLGELAEALDDGRQQGAIAALQRRQYASGPAIDAATDLAEAFKQGFRWRPEATTADASGLAPLYPFKLHE